MTAAAPHHLGLEGAAVIRTRPFVLTERAISDLAEAQAMGAFYGDAGLGKTFAVASAVAGCGLPSVTVEYPLRATMKAVVQGLLEALTGVPHHGERFALTRDLTRELSGAPRLIVVDEAQRLNHDAVETLRMLHDHPDTRFALALVGGNGCWEVLSAHPMLRSRIYRRVAFTRLEWKELAVILPAYHPIYRDAGRELLVLVDEAYARGSFRAWAVFTRTAAGLLEPGQALTEQAVRNSFALLGGNDAAD